MYFLVCQAKRTVLATCETLEEVDKFEKELRAKGKKTKCVTILLPKVGEVWNDQVFWDAVINPIMRY